jgi:hypothetical protein
VSYSRAGRLRSSRKTRLATGPRILQADPPGCLTAVSAVVPLCPLSRSIDAR